MDNFKDAYDELVHKHLALKEKYEEIEGRIYEAGDMWGSGLMGFLIGFASMLLIAVAIN